MIITIDGPAGTGKSTVAKKVAQQLNFIYCDTGAMYRAVTYFMHQNRIAVDDHLQLEKLLEDFSFRIEEIDGKKYYFANGEDVTEKIRSRRVTADVSAVSAVGVVRDKLVVVQRRFAEGSDAVFEGRDMGTVVFPDANLKIFLTATPEVRAERRYLELKATTKMPLKMTFDEVLADIIRRDNYDSSREISPLKQAEDAVVVDTSYMTINEVITAIISKVK